MMGRVAVGGSGRGRAGGDYGFVGLVWFGLLEWRDGRMRGSERFMMWYGLCVMCLCLLC